MSIEYNMSKCLTDGPEEREEASDKVEEIHTHLVSPDLV
jgi:hypothetical protein